MIRVQDEQQVKCLRSDRIDLVGLRGNSEQHMQQVFCVAEVVSRVNERLADVQLVRCRRNRR